MNRLATFTFALVCAFSSQVVSAGDINLSLNLEFNNPADLNSGGTWTVVGKSDLRGIAAIVLEFEQGTLNFNPATGFLISPTAFEVQQSGTFGLRFEIVNGDDLSNPTLDVGVIGGTFPSSYVDDPNLAILGANPDLGTFTGGAELVTGSFNPGAVPTWFDNGVTSTGGQQFANAAGAIAATTNVFTTVRHVVPEPATCAMLCIGFVCMATRRRQ